MTGADSVDLSIFVGLPCYVFKELIELLDSVGHHEHAFALLEATGAPCNRAMPGRLKRLAAAQPFRVCVFHHPDTFPAKLVDVDPEGEHATVEFPATKLKTRMHIDKWDAIASALERGPKFSPGTYVHTRPLTGVPACHDRFVIKQTAIDIGTGKWNYWHVWTRLLNETDWEFGTHSYWTSESQIELPQIDCGSCQVSIRCAMLDERFRHLMRLANGPPLPRVLDPDVVREDKKTAARSQKLHTFHGRRALQPLPRKMPLKKIRVGQRRNR